MEFAPSETQRLIRDTARGFARDVVAPQAAAIDRDEQIPPPLLGRLARLGLMGVNVPE